MNVLSEASFVLWLPPGCLQGAELWTERALGGCGRRLRSEAQCSIDPGGQGTPSSGAWPVRTKALAQCGPHPASVPPWALCPS